MNPPRYLPGTVVYWPQKGHIIVGTVSLVYCYPTKERGEPSGNLYVFAGRSGYVRELELFRSWDAAEQAIRHGNLQ